MPLDRHARRILNMLGAAGGPAGAYTPQGVRQAMEDLARALDPRDAPAVDTRDHLLPGPAGPLPLRGYAPPGTAAEQPLPGLLYLHGGIGVFGSVATHDALCRELCALAAVRVFALEYRLAPEHPYPAAAEDTWFALQWLATHAHGLGIDPARLAVGGDSAGATLATVACRRARDAGAPAVAAQLLLCPVTDLCAQGGTRSELAEGYFLSAGLLRWALDLACPAGVDRRDPDLSPLAAPDLAHLPPAIIHTAEFDPFRDEGAAYARALEHAGVRVCYACHPGLIHHYYGMMGAIPAARAAIAQAAGALARELRSPAADAQAQTGAKNSV